MNETIIPHSPYRFGYEAGQEDFFKALTKGTHDEPVYVALHHRLTLKYALWCLVHNIAQAGAIKLGHENGWWDGAGYHPRTP